MDSVSQAILALKPVTFHYKSDNTNTPQFGLIAEEVAKVNPDLVVWDKNGELVTVRYDAVNAMLLNEFLKEHRKNEEQQEMITQLKSSAANEQTIAVRQQAEIKALGVQLKEQAAQIQRVRAHIQLRKSSPQTVSE
jgi:DNA mismatch repair ATPase MutL